MNALGSISRRTFCALTVTALAAAHTAHAADTPEPGLPVAAPEAVGVDSTPLIRLSEWIRKDRLDVRSLLVVKDDKLIFERYSDGLNRDYNYELYSVTKTITSLVFGILAGEGKIKPDDKIASWIATAHPELEGTLKDKQDIELRHLVSMSSGLYYKQVEGTDPLYYSAPNRLQVALTTVAKVPPGTQFEYTDINPILTAAVLSAAAGMPVQDYAEQKLFQPLAMRNYAWGRADAKGLVSTGWGLRLRPVDMAKIGLLVLHGGRWQDKHLVAEAWVHQMTSPGVVPYFGYYWWINDIVTSEPEYDTMGFKGQFIVVLPKRDAVVVMTSMLPIEGGLRDAKNVQIFRQIVNDHILRALDRTSVPEGQTSADALVKELSLSAQSRPAPGAVPDPYETDTPRK